MYDVKLINPLRQHGTICWDLVFKDPADVFPSVRIGKKYEDSWESSAICADVVATLTAILADATRPPLEYDEEGNPLPQGEGLTVDLAGETLLVDQIGGEVAEWLL